MLEAIFKDFHNMQRALEDLINRTPTSERRNQLTDANIMLNEALAHLYRAERLPVVERAKDA